MVLLSPRESEIADLMLVGADRKRIAQTLGISDETARVHIGAMRRKLGVDSDPELRARLRAMRLSLDFVLEECRKNPRTWCTV